MERVDPGNRHEPCKASGSRANLQEQQFLLEALLTKQVPFVVPGVIVDEATARFLK